MKSKERRAKEQQLLDLINQLSWLEQQEMYVRIALRTRRCPIYPDRPGHRFRALVLVLFVILSITVNMQSAGAWLLAVTSGTLAGSVTIHGMVEIYYGYLRRVADIPIHTRRD